MNTPEKCAHLRFTKGCPSCEYVPEVLIDLAAERMSEWEANGKPSMSLKDYMEKNNMKSMTATPDWEKEFDEKFASTEYPDEIAGAVSRFTIKDFIRTLVDETKKKSYNEGYGDYREEIRQGISPKMATGERG